MTAEQIDLTDMVGDVQVPCEANDHQGEERPAEWIVWLVHCCERRPRFGLSCDGCLQRWHADQSVRVCPCGHAATPAQWISRFERIDRAPS